MTNELTFDPAVIEIDEGQTVTWVNDVAIPHTATNDPGSNPVAEAHPEYSQLPGGAAPWDSGLMENGDSFSHTFTVAGTYTYFCIPHVLSGMVGTIIVDG